MEVDFDGMMDRTKNRVLVKKLITREHALGFGVASGIVGVSMLYSVNDLCALVGLGNLLMYAGMYTPMKRMHIGNTWVGSVVGALPPLIGYAGACGYIDAKALILSAIMFCWQFPHFNALSWNLRNDYDRAGYKMMCFVNPRLCRHTTLRYSLLLTAICAGSPLTGASEAVFVIDSGVLNAYLCYLSWEFYKNPDAKTSRSLFRYSLIHLPLLMIFLLISNQMVKSKENKLKAAAV
jgi:protoheme IX farnesyltransferase